MNIEIRHIYWFEVEYPSTNEKVIRPVVILETKEDGTITIATFAAITSSSIINFDGRFDKWKVPLFKWQECNLEKGSFVKTNCIAEVDSSLFKKRNFIGIMDTRDFKNVFRKVEEFLQSDEDPW